jgi:hypothetical protein
MIVQISGDAVHDLEITMRHGSKWRYARMLISLATGALLIIIGTLAVATELFSKSYMTNRGQLLVAVIIIILGYNIMLERDISPWFSRRTSPQNG